MKFVDMCCVSFRVILLSYGLLHLSAAVSYWKCMYYCFIAWNMNFMEYMLHVFQRLCFNLRTCDMFEHLTQALVYISLYNGDLKVMVSWTSWKCRFYLEAVGNVISEKWIGFVLQTLVYVCVSSRSWIMSWGGRLAVPMLDSGWLRVPHTKIIQNRMRHVMEPRQINWQTTLPNSRQI